MRTSNNNIGDILLAKLESFGRWIVRHAKIVMPIILLICVGVTVTIAVNAKKKDAKNQENVEANSTLEETESTVRVIPQVPLQENTDPQVDALIQSYYNAMVTGDIDTMRTLVDDLDDTEVLRVQEMSKYIEAYPTIDIYTKTGPKENTVLVYVCSEVKFINFEQLLSGMKGFFVHIDENGKYRIVEDEEVEKEDADYIKEVGLQDDVVDMNNKVVAAYNDTVAADADLAEFILELNKEIEKNVGEALVAMEESDEPQEGEEATEPDTEANETASAEPATVVTRVRAIDVVNIRSSDSETADKLGKAAIGDEFKLIEKRGNGWSKIEFEGSEAYVKSEFLEDIEETEAAAAENNEPQAEQEPQVTGTVTVKETVRIRSAASETSDRLGVAYAGDKLEVVMKRADGWTEIKYNGKSAYVKSDYVE